MLHGLLPQLCTEGFLDWLVSEGLALEGRTGEPFGRLHLQGLLPPGRLHLRELLPLGRLYPQGLLPHHRNLDGQP